MNLSEVPTAALLGEIARRCAPLSAVSNGTEADPFFSVSRETLIPPPGTEADPFFSVSRETLIPPPLGTEPPSWARRALRLVAEETGITVPELMDTRSRSACAACNRHLAMWLLRLTTKRSLADIAALWEQDHGTVIYGLHKVRNLRLIDPEFAKFADSLPGKLTTSTLQP